MSHMAVTPPPRPNKFDIIPIHSSDRITFKFCRRQWAWSSPSRLNLIPRADVYGVDKNLWFGTGIHDALEQYYNPTLKRDPAEAWQTWFELQWRGGIVTADEVKQFVDRNPRAVIQSEEELRATSGKSGDPLKIYETWRVDGLCDILPDTHMNEEQFMEMKDLGIGMMKFYKGYAEANDNFRVISLEHDFSVPVINSKGEVLYAVDDRIMPEGWEPDFDVGNEFGPLMRPSYQHATPEDWHIEKQVHVRGRQDMVLQEQEYGRFGIMDYKTASRVDEDYFRHLELDEQCTSYLAFGELEARIHGLEYQSLEFITYQAMLKGYPKPPTITTRGLPSLNRNDETTTPELFAQAIKQLGLEGVYAVDTKMQSYYAYLLEQGDKRYIQRTDTWRNRMQKKNAMIRLYHESVDMLNHPVAYPNPSKNYGCINCKFRTACIQAESGDDYMQTLEDGYIPNWDR